MPGGTKALWLALLIALTGCSEVTVGRCTSDEECGQDGVCDAGLCLRDPSPRLVVALDRTAARLGEMVEVDASASSIPGGGPLSFWFSVEPKEAAVVESLPDAPARARVRLVTPHVDPTVVVRVESGTGRIAEQRRTIQSVNSVPVISLRLAQEAFEPGETAALEALLDDADGDELVVAWSLEGEKGHLEVSGARAVLSSLGDYTGTYRIHASARDAWGGTTETTLDVSPSNRAPRITLHPIEPAPHVCEGAVGCTASLELQASVQDVHPVELGWRLLSGPAGVTAAFTEGAASTHVELGCAPACPIAGTYRFEVQARDSLGAISIQPIEAVVTNRPPVLLAHDGSALPHQAIDGGSRFRASRDRPGFVIWSDPDGDPPDPATVRWISASEAVAFTNPAQLDTPLAAIATLEELDSLEATVIAADLNGAEAADTQALPVDNQPPVITFGGDRSEGHEFVSRSGGTTLYRKAIDFRSLAAGDPEGDPISVSFALDPADAEAAALGVALRSGPNGWYLEGSGSAFIGRSYGIVATATDVFGASTSSIGNVLVSNRPPTIAVPPPEHEIFDVAGQCQLQQCCLRGLNGSCIGPLYSVRVATHFGGLPSSGPARVTRTLTASDPDGDPLDAAVERLANVASSPRLLVNGTAHYFPASAPCSAPAGLSSQCTLSLEIRGFTGIEPITCELPGGTNLGAYAAFEVRVTDGLGGLSAPAPFDLRITADPDDETCP